MVQVKTYLTVEGNSECNPWTILGDLMILGINFAGSTHGHVALVDMSQSPPRLEKIGTWRLWAMWQAVTLYDYAKVIAVGEYQPDDLNHQAAGVTIVDYMASPFITHAMYLKDTGDCNELIGVACDYKTGYLIAGERVKGGNTTGSKYPNGGGLWMIPLESLLHDYETRSKTISEAYRILESPHNSEWRSLAVQYGKLLAALWWYPNYAAIAVTDLDTLAAAVDKVKSGQKVTFNDVFKIVKECDGNVSPYVHANAYKMAMTYQDSEGIKFALYDPHTEKIETEIKLRDKIPHGRTGVCIIGRLAVVHVRNEAVSPNKSDIYIIDLDRMLPICVAYEANYVLDHANYPFDGHKRIFTHNLYTSATSCQVLEIDLDYDVTMLVAPLDIAVPGAVVRFMVQVSGIGVTELANRKVMVCLSDGANRDMYIEPWSCGTGELNDNGIAIVPVKVPENVKPNRVYIVRAILL